MSITVTMSKRVEFPKAQTSQEYVYKPLPSGGFVRYLILQPGKDHEPLHCNLHTISLGEIPEFEAISYVWGNPKRNHIVYCEGFTMYVTSNLRDVLHRVRLSIEPRTLWVDSICICQEDREEQGQQVSLMGHIYSKAKRTLICVGSDKEDHGERAASLLTDVNVMIERKIQETDRSPGSFPSPEANEPFLSDTRWQSIQALLNRPWFSRLWVVQEAALASDARLIWGKVEIDWIMCLKAYEWVITMAPSISIDHALFLPELHMLSFRTRNKDLILMYRGKTRRQTDYFKYNLLDMVDSGRALGVTDDRDRVYGILGLPFPAEQPQLDISPNYKQPFFNTYYDFGEKYLTLTQDMDVLNCVQHDEISFASQNASWVPQWDLSITSSMRYLLRRNPRLTSQTGSIGEPIVLQNSMLKLRGVVFDCLHFLSSDLVFDKDAASIETVAHLWNKSMESDIDCPYPPDFRHLAFIRTLTSGGRKGKYFSWRIDKAAYMLELHQIGAKVNQAILDRLKIQGTSGTAGIVHNLVIEMCNNRKFSITERGYFGLVPRVAQKGDLCCIVFGAKTPFVLRKTTAAGEYRLAGEAYITGKELVSKGGGEGFVMLGDQMSKDWVLWDLEEENIILR